MKKLKTVSIVIPVFNEESYIIEILEKVSRSNTLNLQKEIIVVDDRSTDRTLAKIRNYLKSNKKDVLLIEKHENEGKGSALKVGFLATKGDVIIVQDADLEYSPEEYPQLLAPFIENDADVVYGSRFVTSKPRRIIYFWHYFGNTFLTKLSNVCTNLNLSDMETGYKVFKGNIIRSLAPKLKSNRFGFEPEITAKIAKIKNVRIYEVGIAYHGRTYSEGKKIGWKDGLRAIVEIFRYNFFS